jgi:hypothetical protein
MQSCLRLKEGEATAPGTQWAANPIERAFAKLKALLRKLAARTVESLWHALAYLLIASRPKNAPTTWQTPNMLHSIGIGS